MKSLSERIAGVSPIKLALMVRQLRSEIDGIELLNAEPIAVIGMGCRFPGGVTDPESGMVFDVWMTNGAIYPYYERLNLTGTATYNAFSSVFPPTPRRTDEQHAGVRRDGSGLVPDEPHLGVGQIAQHFVGPDEVQGREAGIDHDCDLGHCHLLC